MQPYLTPERFRTMRTGAALTGWTDLEIKELIADASAIVDAYCNVPMVPEPHSFRGGSVVDEEHEWRYPYGPGDLGQRRVFLFHHPVREVTQFKLLVAAGASAEIPDNSLVINHSERWVEVTSLAIASNSGLFGVTGWIVPIGGLNNPMAQVSYSYGRVIKETLERAYPIADDNVRTYQTSHGFWLTDPDDEVTVDGVPVDPADYTIDQEIGRVTFDADTTGVVRVTYAHSLDRDIVTATSKVMTHLIGVSKNQSRGLIGGIQKVKVGEISIDRGMSSREAGSLLAHAVPEAALLLDGHKFYWMA